MKQQLQLWLDVFQMNSGASQNPTTMVSNRVTPNGQPSFLGSTHRRPSKLSVGVVPLTFFLSVFPTGDWEPVYPSFLPPLNCLGIGTGVIQKSR